MYPLSPTGTLFLHKIKKAEIIFLFIKVYIGIIAYNNAIVREILLHQPGKSPHIRRKKQNGFQERYSAPETRFAFSS